MRKLLLALFVLSSVQQPPGKDYLVYVVSESADKISLIRFGPKGARIDHQLGTESCHPISTALTGWPSLRTRSSTTSRLDMAGPSAQPGSTKPARTRFSSRSPWDRSRRPWTSHPTAGFSS